MKRAFALMLLLFVVTITPSNAQEKGDISDFKILIESTSNGIKMKSAQGSAWIDLSFSLNKNKSQAVDEFGMTRLNQVSPNKDDKLADFLFTITKTKNGVELKGLEGTAWKELAFTLPSRKSQAINAYGMTNWD